MPFALTDEDIASVHGALQPRHRDFEFSQDWFLSLIEAPRARLDPYWAAIGLRECGSLRCTPALQALALGSRVRDVRVVALTGVTHLMGAEATPWLMERLADKRYGERPWTMVCLGTAGDARALAVVQAYAREKRLEFSKPDPLPTVQEEIAAFWLRTLGPAETTRLLETEFAAIAATLRNALAGARPVYRDRVRARLAALAPLLGLT